MTTTAPTSQGFAPASATANQVPLTAAAAASNVPKDAVGRLVDATKVQSQQTSGVVIPELTYFVYMSRAIRNLLTTFIFEWSVIIFHPLTFLSSITVVPVSLFVLLVLEGFFKIGFKLGLGKFIENISNRWGEGYSLANWWDPRIFSDDVKPIVQAGISGLSQPPLPPLKEEDLDNDISIQTRSFNLDMAELLLFMSAIVYERDEISIKDAHTEISRMTSENDGKLRAEDFDDLYEKFHKSEDKIRQQAEKWGLKFTSLSELNSLGGPFSGIFYSEEHNFIVVVFKGTTPTNFEDFIIDLMLQRVDARDFVFGEVHEGFYTSLFPQAENTSSRANSVSPYFTIIRAIRAKAADILNAQAAAAAKSTKDLSEGNSQRTSEQKKINVWVTGHSLGGALATLFFARCLKSKEDLGPNCILRDGYVFGSPSLGDNDFAAGFADYSNKPLDQQSTLWRVIDDTDIIAHLNGFEDLAIRRVLNRYSLFNYVHVGEGIRFFHDGRRPESLQKIFSSGKAPVIVERFGTDNTDDDDTDSDDDDSFNEKLRRTATNVNSVGRKVKDVFKNNPLVREEGNPLDFVESLLPTFFRNHLPARYFEVMQKARVYFVEHEIAVRDIKDASASSTNLINSEAAN